MNHVEEIYSDYGDPVAYADRKSHKVETVLDLKWRIIATTVPVGANTVQNCQHHVKSLKGAIRVFVIWLKIFVPLLERYLSLGLNLVSE